MTDVIVTFRDGEVLHAELPEITFELPVLEVRVRSIDANSRRAILPLTAITRVVVQPLAAAPPASELEKWDRAAFHFLEGDVLRASIAPDAHLGRHGGVWHIVEPGSREMMTLALPYAALKGVFEVGDWDSRPPGARGGADGLAAVTRILAERERHQSELPPQRRRPLLSRVRGRQR